MAAIAITLAAALASLFRLDGISVINLHPALFVLQCGIPATAVAIYCHWAKLHKLRDGCWLILWMSAFFRLLQLPQYAAARIGSPLQDGLLARADRLLGVDVGAIVAFVHRHPGIEAFSMWSYGLMPWMVFAAALIPALLGQIERAKEFLIANIAASLLGAFVLAILPAVGPWAGFHFHPYWNQAWEVTELNALRSSALFTADPDRTCGLIAFPSFHVALAAMSAYALWPLRWLRPFALLAAILIAVSTVTTGWHYASDGLGGALVAWLGIFLARKITRMNRAWRNLN